MYKEIFPKKLKEIRKSKAYTQKEIEIELDIKQSKLSKYETGALEPDIETLCKLIDFYEISADWLLGTGKVR